MEFQIAISYASETGWVARDLHDLLVPYGYSVYCYDKMPDEARGVLRENLRNIYASSWLTILLWSEAYARKPTDSFPAMERRFIVHRHVNTGDTNTLLFVTTDASPIPPDFEIILAHRIDQTGLLGLERLAIDRLRSLSRRPTSHGVISHPPPTNTYRSMPQPCRFRVNRGYATDPLNRWKQLADVLVDFPNDQGTVYVYLIPSGLCTAHLRHTDRLRTDMRYLNAKRAATEEWIASVIGRELAGFSFVERKRKSPEKEILTVYCAEYDRYLNDHMERFLQQTWHGS